MAPNILLQDAWKDSAEDSGEVVFELPPNIPRQVAQIPGAFQNRGRPKQFQHPEDPNPHLLDQRPVSREGTRRFPIRPANPTASSGTRSAFGSARPATIEGAILAEPDRIPFIEEVSDSNIRKANGQNFPSFAHPSIISQNPGVPPPPSTSITQDDNIPQGSIVAPSQGVPRVPHIPRGSPSVTGGTRKPSSTHNHQLTKDTPLHGNSGTHIHHPRPHPRPVPSSTTPPSTTTVYSIDPGVLKLPGHEPEAPADLVLVHHDRAIDVNNQKDVDGGIIVKGDSNLTPEGATALILVGICSVFLVLICFIMFIQKIRQQRIQRKVGGDDDNKSKKSYESSTTTMPSPNPLSFLTPAFLQALNNHFHAAASKDGEFDDTALPSFLTMEPSQSSNQLGRLWFSVRYDYVQQTLVIHILHARYAKGRGSTTNPGDVWVEACVMTPMNTIKAADKTSSRRASLAPVFNQTFTFKVVDEEVTQYLLRLTLYDKHPHNGEKAVGSVIVPLSTVDLCSNATISRDLQ